MLKGKRKITFPGKILTKYAMYLSLLSDIPVGNGDSEGAQHAVVSLIGQGVPDYLRHVQ